MNSNFWIGFLVGILVGIIATAVAVLLWFVPVRSTTTPAAPAAAPTVAPHATFIPEPAFAVRS